MTCLDLSAPATVACKKSQASLVGKVKQKQQQRIILKGVDKIPYCIGLHMGGTVPTADTAV